jgi:hypothetical protein
MLIAVSPWDVQQFDCQIRQAGDLPPSSPPRKSRETSRKGTGMAIPRNDRAPDCLDMPIVSAAGKTISTPSATSSFPSTTPPAPPATTATSR